MLTTCHVHRTPSHYNHESDGKLTNTARTTMSCQQVPVAVHWDTLHRQKQQTTVSVSCVTSITTCMCFWVHGGALYLAFVIYRMEKSDIFAMIRKLYFILFNSKGVRCTPNNVVAHSLIYFERNYELQNRLASYKNYRLFKATLS